MTNIQHQKPGQRLERLDALRGFAVLWMTVFHFCFDLNQFGFIRADFYHSPVWLVQRTCILSLFLLCAGMGQAIALAAGQTRPQFARRWLHIAGCACLVSVGSAFMFPHSWIYFGVLHGMAVMLLICRSTAALGRWLWPLGLVPIALALGAGRLHEVFPMAALLDWKALSWIGLVSHKPITEDFVPLLPWLGVMWWGMAAGQLALSRGWLYLASHRPAPNYWVTKLAFVGRWSLSWYMLHQLILLGLVAAAAALFGR